MAADLERYRRKGKVLRREEVDAPGPRSIVGRGLQPVYVIADDKQEAVAWARANKPGFAPKFGSTRSPTASLGLRLKDQPVYVLRSPLPAVRDAWLRTGARLVYL